jgi:hypothetical protein
VYAAEAEEAVASLWCADVRVGSPSAYCARVGSPSAYCARVYANTYS